MEHIESSRLLSDFIVLQTTLSTLPQHIGQLESFSEINRCLLELFGLKCALLELRLDDRDVHLPHLHTHCR